MSITGAFNIFKLIENTPEVTDITKIDALSTNMTEILQTLTPTVQLQYSTVSSKETGLCVYSYVAQMIVVLGSKVNE